MYAFLSANIERFEPVLAMLSHDELSQLEMALRQQIDETIIADFLIQREIQSMFNNDKLHLALKSGLAWGDLMIAMPASAFMTEEKPKQGCLPEDWDWSMPILCLRKDIWENFPVTVSAMVTKDGSERYAIRWHHKNFLEARDNVENYLDYIDFEENTYRRLFKALSASRYWTVSEAEGRDDICVIVMNSSSKSDETMFVKPVKSLVLPSKNLDDEVASVASSSSEEGWEQVGAKIPVLKRLNDIKAHFPVVWRAVEGTKVATYAIELHGKTLKEKGLNAKEVKTDLLKALRFSTAWTVKDVKSDKEVCQIEMTARA